MNVYFCLAASAVLCGVELAAVTRSDSVTGASHHTNNFVEVIKNDLKRNNDDYKQLTTQSKFTPTNEQLDDTIATLPLVFDNKSINAKNNVKTFRRIKDQSYKHYELLNKETAHNDKVKGSNATPTIVTNHTPRLRKLLSPVFNFKPPVENQSMTEKADRDMLPLGKSSPGVAQNVRHIYYSPSAASKSFNVKKIDKFKQFVERNKKLFKEYLSSKVNIPTPKAQLRQFNANETEQNKLKEHEKSKVWSEDDVGELPDAAVLDMAPGKGGRIHKQRIKGRLCHRHVLLPEGPKYDGAGRLPPRSPRLPPRRPPRRPPRAPALLLPRCCNCCKKSVLGCE